jgi:hypothetical protein
MAQVDRPWEQKKDLDPCEHSQLIVMKEQNQHNGKLVFSTNS